MVLNGRKWRVAGEGCILKRIINLTPHQILHGDQIKDYIDGTCSTHGRDEKCIENFGQKT